MVNDECLCNMVDIFFTRFAYIPYKDENNENVQDHLGIYTHCDLSVMLLHYNQPIDSLEQFVYCD